MFSCPREEWTFDHVSFQVGLGKQVVICDLDTEITYTEADFLPGILYLEHVKTE